VSSGGEQLQLGATLVSRGGNKIREGLHAGGRHQPLASTSCKQDKMSMPFQNLKDAYSKEITF